jgi:hypothetical protein
MKGNVIATPTTQPQGFVIIFPLKGSSLLIRLGRSLQPAALRSEDARRDVLEPRCRVRVSNDRVLGVRVVSGFSAIFRHNLVACHTLSGQCEAESCAARGIIGSP